MSAHLMIAAGYLDLALSHKLALMKFCDSADDQNRLAYPGLDAVRLWAGTKRSRTLDVIRELQEAGLVMQVAAGHRGKRAVFKVFPNPGDDVFSLAHQQGRACPGREKFKGAPGVPTAEEVLARIEAADADAGPWNGKGAADQSSKGPDTRTQTIGSDLPDPIDERVRNDGRKGPISRTEGSGEPDPFSPLQSLASEVRPPTASPAADEGADGALFDPPGAPPSPSPEPRPETETQRAGRLARTYTDAVPLSNFLAVRGVALKAIRASHDGVPCYTDHEIGSALARLASERRSVTTETLRIEIEGQTPMRRPSRAEETLHALSGAGDFARAREAELFAPPLALSPTEGPF